MATKECTLCDTPFVVFENKQGHLCEIHYNLSNNNPIGHIPNRIVYIAGPISNGHRADPRQIYQNVKFAQKFYFELIEKGYSPICPHLSYYAWLDFPDDVHWKRWIDMDLDFVDAAFALLRIPGKSIGADKEVEYAHKLNKPVYYDVDDMPKVDPPSDKLKHIGSLRNALH